MMAYCYDLFAFTFFFESLFFIFFVFFFCKQRTSSIQNKRKFPPRSKQNLGVELKKNHCYWRTKVLSPQLQDKSGRYDLFTVVLLVVGLVCQRKSSSSPYLNYLVSKHNNKRTTNNKKWWVLTEWSPNASWLELSFLGIDLSSPRKSELKLNKS